MLDNLDGKRIALKKNISKTVLILKVMTLIDTIISVVGLVLLSLVLLFFMELLGSIFNTNPDTSFNHGLMFIMPSAIIICIIFFFIYRWYSSVTQRIAADVQVSIVVPLALSALTLLFFLYRLYNALTIDNKALGWPFNLYEILMFCWLIAHVGSNGMLANALYNYNKGLTDELNNNTELTE